MIIPTAVQQHMEQALSNSSIRADWQTLTKSSNQGMMTLMMTVESTAGTLAIHYNAEPLDEQSRVAMASKISAITKHLETYVPEFPSQHTVAEATFADGSYYIIQKYLPGQPLGSRSIDSSKITDTYEVPEEHAHKLQKAVDYYTALLHSHPMPGFGFLVVKDGVLTGTHESWESFLREESDRWIKELYETTPEPPMREQIKKIESALAALIPSHPELFELPQGYFIHGDVVNPSNVIVDGDAVVGIIDFELSLSGDPAWEFTHTDARPTAEYYESRDITDTHAQDAFATRIDFCTIFWSIWGAYLHCRINRYGLKEMLLDRAEEKLREF